MSRTSQLRLAAAMLFLGIAISAFGAHGLADRLEATGRIDNWETATLYHLIHGLAMLIVTIARPALPGYFWFLTGIIIFSGSLYALALTDISRLGAITPFGGVSFLIGWARCLFAKASTLES